jgi:hypothetical protein
VEKAVLVAGILAIVAGLALALVPPASLSAACSGSSCAPNFTVAFTFTASQGTVDVTDMSHCLSTCPGRFPSETLAWGDGSPNSTNTNGGKGWTSLPTGATFAHTYAVSGTYVLTLTLENIICIPHECLYTSGVATQEVATSGGGGGSYSITASFNLAASGLDAYLNDTTSTSGQLPISSIELSWGDGYGANEVALGFHATHAYAVGGTFNVTEVVNYVIGSKAGSSLANETICVGGASVCGGGGGGGGGVSVPPFAANALTLPLLIGGAAFAVAAVVPGEPFARYVPAALLALGAFGAGWAIGGLGPL